MYELSAKNDRLIWFDQKELIFCNLIFCFIYYKVPFTGKNEMHKIIRSCSRAIGMKWKTF